MSPFPAYLTFVFTRLSGAGRGWAVQVVKNWAYDMKSEDFPFSGVLFDLNSLNFVVGQKSPEHYRSILTFSCIPRAPLSVLHPFGRFLLPNFFDFLGIIFGQKLRKKFTDKLNIRPELLKL